MAAAAEPAMDYFSIPIKEPYTPFHWQGNDGNANAFEELEFSSPSEGSSSGYFSDSDDEQLEETQEREQEQEQDEGEYESDAIAASFRSRTSRKSPASSSSSSSSPSSSSSKKLSFSNPDLIYPTYTPSSETPIYPTYTPSSEAPVILPSPPANLASEPFRLRFPPIPRLRKTNPGLDVAMRKMERHARFMEEMERRGLFSDSVERGESSEFERERDFVEGWRDNVVHVRVEEVGEGVKGKTKARQFEEESDRGRTRHFKEIRLSHRR